MELRKTKIVCTLGPATDREGILRQMMLAGMNVARFNFSHGSHEEHHRRLEALKALREELDLPIACVAGLGMAPFWISDLISNSVEPIISQLLN